MLVLCNNCQCETDKAVGAVNRAKAIGAPLYCNRTCAGRGRRDHKTAEQKKEEKRLYDMAYREKNIEMLKVKKHEYFKRSYDPAEAAVKRKETMPRHVEYCRTPEYKEWKKEYDEKHRAKKLYGEFWECAILALAIEKEVNSRITRPEIAAINGTLNKSQTRRRNYERTFSNQP